jgi:hypothetical protein
VKEWNSIALAAIDLQISERTGWRWLRSGRIEKRKNKDGRLFFALTSEVNDPATDSHDMSDSVKFVSSNIKSYRKQGKKMSVEAERTSIALDCLKVLYVLKTESAYQVRSYQGLTIIKWFAEEARKGIIFWMEIKRILNNAYVGIGEGVRSKDELKGLWYDLLKVRTAWDREQSAQVQELERFPDPESQSVFRFMKAELKNTLTQFDLVLEGLKQLLILAIETDTRD